VACPREREFMAPLTTRGMMSWAVSTIRREVRPIITPLLYLKIKKRRSLNSFILESLPPTFFRELSGVDHRESSASSASLLLLSW